MTRDPTPKPGTESAEAWFAPALERARAGDPAAFEALFEPAADPLLYYCEVRLGPRLRGECEPIDIVQESYLQAFGAIPSLECAEWSGFLRWLYRIAENRIRSLHDHATAQKRTPPGPRAHGSQVLDRLRASLTGPLSAAMRSEKRERLREALDALDGDERTAVVFHYFHGATVRAIAEELDRSETATRRLLGRALDRLGRSIGGSGRDANSG